MEKSAITKRQIEPNGVHDVMALSNASTMQMLGNGVLSRCKLLAGCKEARVVLVDLKYSDRLTQQQRRELTPKRRKPSSVTSQRTKNLLKEIAKEESVAWMDDWTDSSVELDECFETKKKNKSKRGRRTQWSRRKNTPLSRVFIKREKDLENESPAPKEEKPKMHEGTKRGRGRPRRKAIRLEDPEKVSVVATSASNFAGAKIKVEEDRRCDLPDGSVKIENGKDLRLNVMNLEVQRKGNSTRGQGRGKRAQKIKTRKTSDTNNLKNLFATFRGDEDSQCDENEAKQSSREIKQEMLSPPTAAQKEFLGNNQLNVVSAQMKITTEPEITAIPLKLEISSTPKPIIKIFTNHESYDRTIEEVVAAGRNPTRLENGVEFQSVKFIKVTPERSDNSGEKKAIDPLIFSGKEPHIVGPDVLNVSIASSGSTRSGESGKRKLPEIIQDSVLPKGTIEIPSSVKPKTPCRSEKRRKMKHSHSDISQNLKNNGKCNFSLTNNSQSFPNGGPTSLSQPHPGQLNFLYKSCEVKLSREFTFPSLSQPSIVTNFNGKEKTNSYWDDAFNNNRSAAPINDNDLPKSNDDPRPYSDSRLCSSPLSNVTDEANALADLLAKPSAVVDDSFIDIFYGDENLEDPEPLVRQNDLTISSEPKCQKKVKPLEKLTLKNLNIFNNRVETLAGQLKTNSQKLQVANGQSSGLGSGDSEKSRKRKYESTTKSGSQKDKVNGNVTLVRKHWENQGKWILDTPGPSSMGFETHSSLSNEPRASGKLDKPIIPDPPLKRIRVETANRNFNNNLEKSETIDHFLQKSDKKAIITNLPRFGESAVNKATSDSSSSSGSSSSSSDSTFSGDGGSGSNPPGASGPRTIEEALEKEIAMIKGNCMKGFKIPRLSKKNEVPMSIEEINDTEVPPKSQELPAIGSGSLSKNINPVTIDSEAEMSSKKINRPVTSKNVETGAETPENCENSIIAGIELNTIQTNAVAGANGDPNDSEHSAEEDLEELCDAETLACKNNAAGSVGQIDEEEEEDDCISLDTESLCLSGIETPPLHTLEKSSKPSGRQERSPVVAAPPPPPPPPTIAPEPYARMRSSNIGKFVAENVRECEESFETFKDNVVISETMFNGVPTEVALNSVSQKQLEPPIVQQDLRTTLNSRTISRDIPALFRGLCYAWLRLGNCRNRMTCRFFHSRGWKLNNIQQYDLKNIQEILTYSATHGYSYFIELALNDAMTKMSTLQIKSVYRQLRTASVLTIPHIESIIDALRIRQLTSTDILGALTESVAPEDTETRSKIQLAMYKKLEPENCWNVLAKLIIQIKAPISIIQTIMEETVRKNCRQEARAIYEKVLQRMTVEEVKGIPQDLWDLFKRLTFPAGSCTPIDPIYRVEPTPDFDDGGVRHNISPESPKPERVVTPIDDLSIKSPSIEPPIPRKINPNHPRRSTLSRTSQSRSSSDFEDTSYSLQPIDKLPPPKCPYRDYLWKFHWDLQGMQEGLKHKDYAHVISILKHYAAYPNRLPHIQGFYDILIKEITSARHHLDEIIRLTVQSGSSDQLRLYVYDLGINVVTKLADSGAWIHAYELLKTFQLYGSYNTCAFTLLAAQIYIANRRPSKALDLLEKSRLVCTNGRKWRQVQCKEDEDLRVTVLDLLLYSLCDGYADDALRLLDFILRDQCSTFKPINLIPHVERIVRLILLGKHKNLVVDIGRLILQAKLFVGPETFRSLINHVFHDDRVLAKQLHRYATWLGTYNRAKINTASCVHMIININWTEEETFLMISSLMDELSINIGHAIDRIKVRQLNIFLIFEVIPSEKELSADVSSDGLLSITVINRRRATVKSVLERFDPKIKMVRRYQGRICKLQSQSVIAYLKSGHVTL